MVHDSFIRRGRYPDFKGPLPFTRGYELVGVVEKGVDVVSPREGQIVADLCVVGGYAQYAIRPHVFLCLFQTASIPRGRLHPACRAPDSLPDAYTVSSLISRGNSRSSLSARQAHWYSAARSRVILASKQSGTCSTANLATVERFGATAIDYRAGDFVASVRKLTAGRVGGAGVDAAFDAICVGPGRLSRARGHPHRLRLPDDGNWARKHNRGGVRIGAVEAMGALSFLFRGRRDLVQHHGRRLSHPDEFRGRHGCFCSSCSATVPFIRWFLI